MSGSGTRGTLRNAIQKLKWKVSRGDEFVQFDEGNKVEISTRGAWHLGVITSVPVDEEGLYECTYVESGLQYSTQRPINLIRRLGDDVTIRDVRLILKNLFEKSNLSLSGRQKCDVFLGSLPGMFKSLQSRAARKIIQPIVEYRKAVMAFYANGVIIDRDGGEYMLMTEDWDDFPDTEKSFDAAIKFMLSQISETNEIEDETRVPETAAALRDLKAGSLIKVPACPSLAMPYAPGKVIDLGTEKDTIKVEVVSYDAESNKYMVKVLPKEEKVDMEWEPEDYMYPDLGNPNEVKSQSTLPLGTPPPAVSKNEELNELIDIFETLVEQLVPLKNRPRLIDNFDERKWALSPFVALAQAILEQDYKLTEKLHKYALPMAGAELTIVMSNLVELVCLLKSFAETECFTNTKKRERVIGKE